jgi:hypothetical protein
VLAELIALCERAHPLVGRVPSHEQETASDAWRLCHEYAEQGTTSDEARRTLSRHVEYLARRNALGIPLATLGRAVLAHQSGSKRDYELTLADAELKLTLAEL